ncbi:DUF2516 family protein [Nocardioides campestrisoli]|uniref:DUF2516 family protein n=1 Tax=Nocardioides campestrisoli TaxID=2736757 RepID=UPI001C62798D|nr:DUF2516 family protein [Nocardioides campestrisoli]
MDFFAFQSGLMLLVFFGLLLVKGFAFVTALMFSAEAYEAAGKLTKVAWCAILGLGFATQLILPGPLGILNLAFTIAAFVYLADVRPALKGLTRR